MIGWLGRHTSMRGRLSISLITLMVAPLVVTGIVYVNGMSESDRDHRLTVSQGIAMGTKLRLDEAVTSFTTWLDRSLVDLALELSRAADPTSLRDHLPADLAPDIVARVDSGGRWTPEAPIGWRAELSPWLATGDPELGYAALPLSDGQLGLFQVVVEPRPAGSFVVARHLDATDDPGVFDTMPLHGNLVRAVSAGPRLVAVAGEPSYAAGWSSEVKLLWEQALDTPEEGTIVGGWRDDRLIGAAVLRGRNDKPAGLAVVQVTLHDLLPYAEFLPAQGPDGPVIADRNTMQIKVLVGWIAVMGVVIAVTMGLIAPQWIWRDMRDSTDRIFGSVARLRELVGRNGRALTEQLQAVTLLNDSMGRLEREAQSISDTTRSLAASAEQSARVSQTGNHTAEMAQRSVLDVRDQVADIGDMMTRLGRRTTEIGDILGFLDQLSEGTKKLSVNASIKASDPQSAARQLGYIAGEMRELAEQALDSTQDIEQRIQEIQKSSESTSEATKSGRREVERCLESFEELEAVFSRILRWVDETTQFARNIESSTTTQTESLQTVAESVGALRRRVTETEGNFRDIEDAIDELATLGEELIELWKVNQ